MRLPFLLSRVLPAGLAIAGLSTLAKAQGAAVPAPPGLLLGPGDFERLNALAGQQPWARAQREKILAEAANFPGSYEKKFGLSSMELPPEGAQWSHLYVNPVTGKELHFRPPNHNVSPDTKEEFPGAPYDQCVYQDRAFALADGALTSALAYRLTGERADAEKGAAVLKAYADRYDTYPMHSIWKKKPGKSDARVFCQTLDEAEWLIKISWAYDLLRDSPALTGADRAHIERDLIAPCAEVVRNGAGTRNIEAWMNGGVIAAGYALGDQALVDHALNGPKGFHRQMAENVVDGFWVEGALGYQYYAIEPLELTAQMAARKGIDLWKTEPNLERLLLSPLEEMFPDGTTPAFNDSTGGKKILEERAYLYEAP